MTKTMTALALAAVLALVACGGGDDDTGAGAPTTEADAGAATTTTAAAGVPDAAVAYLDALSGGDVTSVGGMAEHAAPGSPAALYATYQLASARYAGSIPPSTSDVQGDQVEQCVEQINAAGDTETVCTMFGAFEVDGAGKLVTFSTDGSPIADRLRAGDPAGVSVDGVTATVVTSYLTSRGDLLVTVDFTNGREGVARVDDCSASYVGPDGRHVGQMCVSSLPEVQPGATTSVVYGIEQATPGGTLTVAVDVEREAGSGDFYSDITMDLPVPA